MTDIAKDMIAGLTELAESLEANVPIEATRIERVVTPDGPMHIREHIVIEPADEDGE